MKPPGPNANPLQVVHSELKRCVRCGACRAHCPAFQEWEREPAVARGKLALAQHLIEADLAPDDSTSEAMSKCLLCGSCVQNCPNEVPTDEIVMLARETLAEHRGLSLFQRTLSALLRYRDSLKRGLPFSKFLSPFFLRRVPGKSGLRLRFPVPYLGGRRFLPEIARKPFLDRYPEIITGKAGRPRIAFFTGCMIQFVYPQVGEAAWTLLQRMGCTLILPKNQQCCGLPAFSGGDLQTVRFLAEKNLRSLEACQADYIVTACATCQGALSQFYPNILGKKDPASMERWQALSSKVVDATQLLIILGFQPTCQNQARTSTLTYHDPCHLRNRKITREPRSLLASTPGVQLIEMEGADRCCGLGGTFNVHHYEASMRINLPKVEAIRRTRAETVVTGCPGCMLQLSNGLQSQDLTIPVRHTLEILAGS